MVKECVICLVGERRNGDFRYWCTTHQASANSSDGTKLERCGRLFKATSNEAEAFHLDACNYPGGVALWGAVSAVYSTAAHAMPELGVHTHARRQAGGKKQIDRTFRSVITTIKGSSGEARALTIGEKDAIHYMIAQVLGVSTKYIECTFCRHPHLDRDWFSVHPHINHLCSACGRNFLDVDVGIGNPLIMVKQQLGDEGILRDTVLPNRSLNIVQKDYPLGLELWGSNQAIVWTAGKPEERGIHVHCYTSNNLIPTVDETFDTVVIDGLTIDDAQLRVLMGQRALPYLAGKVVALDCPRCRFPHFDTGEGSYKPHLMHECLACQHHFLSPGEAQIVSNPMVGTLNLLEAKAPRSAKRV